MEVVTQRTMKGSEWQEEILARWGSRAALDKAARKKTRSGRLAAIDALTLREFEEKPRRKARNLTVTSELEVEDLQGLTGARMDLLAILDKLGSAKVTELAKRARRDKKNVSEDIKFLTGIGAVIVRKQGREKIVRPSGAEIRIRLSSHDSGRGRTRATT